MRAAEVDVKTSAPLHPGEIVLWTGPAALLPAILLVPFLLCFGVVILVFWATWFSPARDCYGKVDCATFEWLMLVLLVLFAFGLLFLLTERFLLSSGRARTRIMLTDRRLIRIVDWPWLRVCASDYRVNLPYLVTPGVLRHGRYTLFSLSPQDAQKVLDLIQRQRATTR